MNTFTRLSTGEWGISVEDEDEDDCDEGDIVEVVKASGEVVKERLGAHLHDKHFRGRKYAVYAIGRRGYTSPPTPPPPLLNPSIALSYAVLGLVPPVTLSDARRAHRERCSLYHPDKGGSNVEAAAINRALEAVEGHIGGSS